MLYNSNDTSDGFATLPDRTFDSFIEAVRQNDKIFTQAARCAPLLAAGCWLLKRAQWTARSEHKIKSRPWRSSQAQDTTSKAISLGKDPPRELATAGCSRRRRSACSLHHRRQDTHSLVEASEWRRPPSKDNKSHISLLLLVAGCWCFALRKTSLRDHSVSQHDTIVSPRCGPALHATHQLAGRPAGPTRASAFVAFGMIQPNSPPSTSNNEAYPQR